MELHVAGGVAECCVDLSFYFIPFLLLVTRVGGEGVFWLGYYRCEKRLQIIFA